MTATTKSGKDLSAPDLIEFRKRYPLTVAHFGPLGNREEYLRKVWEADERWRETVAQGRAAREVIVRDAPPEGLEVEAEFEVIFAGGVMGLVDGAVLAHRYKRRVMVFDAHRVGQCETDWNISYEELPEFERAGLFTAEEVRAALIDRHRAGLVKFYDESSRVRAPVLWMSLVLDTALDAGRLLALAAEKIRVSETGSALFDGLRFVRSYVRPDRVLVETEDVRTKARRLFSARLFVDTTGAGSPVARQLNEGRPFTHVCPTVGTVARGFQQGFEAEKMRHGLNDLLVSLEDVEDHRQLIWESFAGHPQKDEFTTYLLFYDAVDSPADKSLLALFERYFEKLPEYKLLGAQWRVVKPLFGYTHGFQPQGWAARPRTAADRVMLLGNSAGFSSPLNFSGPGPHVRQLKRLTHLIDLALEADALDASSLAEISASEPGVAQVATLAEFLRPAPQSPAPAVNETLNAVMAALHNLDECVRRDLFHDRMTFAGLKNLLSHTVRLYPRILQRVREHLGARGTF
ncbi:MAG TPA: hypothetical protein VF507_01635, partial [Pyrinomonadaceae bacterium]